MILRGHLTPSYIASVVPRARYAKRPLSGSAADGLQVYFSGGLGAAIPLAQQVIEDAVLAFSTATQE
jgi:hypothetical protein